MTRPITLSIYICRQFAGAVVGMLLALSGLVALFDFIELLRRSASKPDRGIIRSLVEVTNQAGDPVLRLTAINFILVRDPG